MAANSISAGTGSTLGLPGFFKTLRVAEVIAQTRSEGHADQAENDGAQYGEPGNDRFPVLQESDRFEAE